MKEQENVSNDDLATEFQTTCPSCGIKASINMSMMDIPHFKEVIIMTMACDECGYKSNEVKGGGEIPLYGTKITLHAETVRDLSRAVVKSDSACLAIPEIDFELKESGLGLCTTVEGLLLRIHNDLKQANPFVSKDGDANATMKAVKFEQFLVQLKNMAEGKILPFTLRITDPISNSFVGSVQEGNQPFLQQTNEFILDDNITVEEFHRSQEENDRFSLT